MVLPMLMTNDFGGLVDTGADGEDDASGDLEVVICWKRLSQLHMR